MSQTVGEGPLYDPRTLAVFRQDQLSTGEPYLNGRRP